MCEPEAERCYQQRLEATWLVWFPQVVAVLVAIAAILVIRVILRCYPQQLEATWWSGCHQIRNLPTPPSDGNQLAS